MANEFKAAAFCALGAERVVSNEIKKMGLPVSEAAVGRVSFCADTAGLYRTLLSLRAADRVLLECGRFYAGDFDDLFEGASEIPWEAYIPKNMGLKVDKVRTRNSRLAALTSVQAVVHKAAAQRLCDAHRLNRRLPESESPAEIRVYIEKDHAAIYLDLSGAPLFKRGYRREGGAAPLRETTAAALLLLSGWKRKFPLYDPFCGAGTIAIEAALYAWDAAPGLGRSFALSKLLIASKKAEAEVREELRGRVDFSRRVRIYGSDSDGGAIAQARANARRALDLGQSAAGPALREAPPHFSIKPMAEARAPDDAEGFIITNPPYGRRLGEPLAAEENYQEMAVLLRNFPGWQIGVICDHPGFESHFGRAASEIREITNGAVKTYFYQFKKGRT